MHSVSLSGRRWRAEARGPAWRLGGRLAWRRAWRSAWRRAWLERGLEQEVEVPARAARVEHGLARALAARDELGGLGEVAGEERGVEAAARGGGEGERGGGGARVQAARVHRPPLVSAQPPRGDFSFWRGGRMARAGEVGRKWSMQRPWSTPVSRGEKTRSQWVSKCVIFRLSRHVSISEEYNMKLLTPVGYNACFCSTFLCPSRLINGCSEEAMYNESISCISIKGSS